MKIYCANLLPTRFLRHSGSMKVLNTPTCLKYCENLAHLSNVWKSTIFSSTSAKQIISRSERERI
ncbi:MAG: hypothetical protein ACFE9S_01500 [Candidatus Hermodarchaeota archaeon]